jgi:hypothetical protein
LALCYRKGLIPVFQKWSGCPSARLVFVSLFIFIVATVADVLAQVELEAFSGTPYGVGRVSFRVPRANLPTPLGASGISVGEAGGRVVYPAISSARTNPFIKNILLDLPIWEGGPILQQTQGILSGFLNAQPKTTIYFLFKGDAPFELQLGLVPGAALPVVPVADPAAREGLLLKWWDEFSYQPEGLLANKPDYPPLVKNYLCGLLAREMGLAVPEIDDPDSWREELKENIGLFVGTEQVMARAIRLRMAGDSTLGEVADLPPAKRTVYPALELPTLEGDIPIETIAERVPEESLYIRFGSFANFLWFQDTLDRWGGDMRNLLALRGINEGISKKIEEQLVIKQTVLGRMLGGTVVSDVAMVGTDLFMREGAAFGLLFETRQAFLFTRELLAQRAERVKKGEATDKKVEIAGKEVSYLSSPDGRVRSYFLVDGSYVLVTTSKNLMRRFIETGQKDSKTARPLGSTAEFRHARQVMPIDQGDKVFLYFSDPFFRQLASPGSWIEMSRRLQAAADIVSVQLAQAAASGSGEADRSIDALKLRGRLPKSFGPRPDRTYAEIKNGDVLDSLRGTRGYFLPIADCLLEKITISESDAYRDFLEYYHGQWGRLDPMMVALKQEAVLGGNERITIDLRANPFAREHFDKFSQKLGSPQKDRIAPVPGNLAQFEAVLTEQRLFGGIRNVAPAIEMVDGRPTLQGGLKNLLIGYLGTTGQPGVLGLLDAMVTIPEVVMPQTQSKSPRRDGRRDLLRDGRRVGGRFAEMGLRFLDSLNPQQPAAGLNKTGPNRQSFLGIYRYQDERFTVYSLQQQVLDRVAELLRFEPAKRPAQIRLRVANLDEAAGKPLFNALAFYRTRQTSASNLQLLFSLHQQLGVPQKECLEVAQKILAAKLLCPLGGDYIWRKGPGGAVRWTTTAAKDGLLLETEKLIVPESFTAPPLDWFRGLEMDATMDERQFSSHIELIWTGEK